MTVAMTPAVCRLLFVCFFCTLWGGQVIASDKGAKEESVQSVAEKAKEALELLRATQEDLAEAEECKNVMSEALNKREMDIDMDKLRRDAGYLLGSVENATEEAEKAGNLLKTLAEEEIKDVFAEAVKKMQNLSEKLKTLNEKTKIIHSIFLTQKPHNKNNLKAKLGEITQPLKEAMMAAQTTVTALEEATKKTAELEKGLQGAQDGDVPSEKVMVTTSGGDEEEGAQPPTDGKDSATHSPQGPTGNTPTTDMPTDGKDSAAHSPQGPTRNTPTTDMSREVETLLAALQEGYDADSTYGGAIATCTAAPLLLLLTAVAYAAVC